MGGGILLLAPMRGELGPLVRALHLRRSRLRGATVFSSQAPGGEMRAALCGVGDRRAARETERLLTLLAPDRVVVVGVAGAVDPSVGVGDVVVPAVVVDDASGRELTPAPLPAQPGSGTLLTSPHLHVGPEATLRLRHRGITAVDMESAAVAAVCVEHGHPWSVIRGISDRTDDGTVDAQVRGLLRPDGSADLPAVARYLLAAPARVRVLLRLARGLRRGAGAAANVAAACVGPPGEV